MSSSKSECPSPGGKATAAVRGQAGTNPGGRENARTAPCQAAKMLSEKRPCKSHQVREGTPSRCLQQPGGAAARSPLPAGSQAAAAPGSAARSSAGAPQPHPPPQLPGQPGHGAPAPPAPRCRGAALTRQPEAEQQAVVDDRCVSQAAAIAVVRQEGAVVEVEVVVLHGWTRSSRGRAAGAHSAARAAPAAPPARPSHAQRRRRARRGPRGGRRHMARPPAVRGAAGPDGAGPARLPPAGRGGPRLRPPRLAAPAAPPPLAV